MFRFYQNWISGWTCLNNAASLNGGSGMMGLVEVGCEEGGGGGEMGAWGVQQVSAPVGDSRRPLALCPAAARHISGICRRATPQPYSRSPLDD